MRAVFCGTPEFSVPGLRALLDAGVRLPLVVSRPDRVRRRRGRPEPSPVREFALEHGLETAVLERGGRSRLYERILACEPDVVVVVAFGHIVREPLLHGAPLGCVNVHASLLPRWRGPAPIHTSIVAGDRATGVCTMQMAEGVDTGDVYEVARTEIGPDETAGQLHDRLADLGGSILVSTLAALDRGDLEATPQSGEGVCHAPMLERAEGSVDFNAPAQKVHDRIRGLDPWPGTRVSWEGATLRIASSTLGAGFHDARPGSILAIDEAGLRVACAEGAVELRTVQAEGGRPVSPVEFGRGHPLRVGQVLSPLPGFSPREPRR
jgi:methionyl-tRNA formyltransferase